MKSSANRPPSRIRRQPVSAEDVDSQEDMDVDDREGPYGAAAAPASAAATAAGGSHADVDDDDEIVREIPVYMSPALSRQLYLIQYPLQQNPHWTPPEAARVRPRHNMVEIDYPTPDNIHLHGTYRMPSRTFASHTVPVSTHMALGKLMATPGRGGGGAAATARARTRARARIKLEDDAADDDGDDDGGLVDSSDDDERGASSRTHIGLHLVPLSRISQMRPTFSHIDEAAASASATTEDELKQQQEQRLAEQTAAQNMERRPISLQKKESERAALARKSSYGFKKASEEAEPWQPLEVYDETSDQARAMIMDQVRCPRPMDNLLQEKVRFGGASSAHQSLNEVYVGNLNYLPPPADGPPLSFSSSNDGADVAKIVAKLVRLMHQGWPVPYSLLRAQFSAHTVSDATLLVALGSCAVLVRGNFCLASRLLPFPSPAMTQARTFLLLLFQTMGVVHRARLEHVYSPRGGTTNGLNGNRRPSANWDDSDGEVTPAVLQMLLEQVGKKTHGGWVSKVDDDATFGEAHPQAALVHVRYWAEQLERFRDKLLRYREPLHADVGENSHYSRSFLDDGGGDGS